jgi:glycosyltransferase involved in cell wall biosynthesis
MNFVDAYLTKHNVRPLIKELPDPHLNICIVIPCFNEPDLIRTLESVYHCHRPALATEGIVVVNAPVNASVTVVENNKITLQKASIWINAHNDPKLKFHLIHSPDLPEKTAGVGFARKIGMDEAVFRFHQVNNHDGIIVSLDADAHCDSNYLTETEHHYQKFAKTPGASVYFEHPIEGHDFEPDIYKGITLYELHLRYINQAFRYAAHPHAYHTVGSSFSVRMDAYVKQGGMNKRQAGEDYYFLQKIISLGNYSEINTTRIIPSPRISDRVPFGTGNAIKHFVTDNNFKTYSLEAFVDIKSLLGQLSSLYEGDKDNTRQIVASLALPLREFLQTNSFLIEWESVKENSASFTTFRNRFFRWFNAFKVIKYLNFTADKYYEKQEVVQEAKKLPVRLGLVSPPDQPSDLLKYYRKLDRTGFGII